MYNYSVNLTYRDTDDDDVYRSELLECLSTPSIEGVDPHILSVYDEYGENYDIILDKLKITQHHFSSMSCRSLFFLLFCWEYFYENHKLLQALHSNVGVDKALETLLNKIST